MKLGRAAMVAVMVVVGGCASNSQVPRDQRWFLLAATPTQEYPLGKIAAPMERWPRVMAYASLDECAASLWDASNELQRPVQCVAGDDPRIQNVQVSSMSVARSDQPAARETRMLALGHLPTH